MSAMYARSASESSAAATKTARSPRRAPITPPTTGPIENERPKVASARPYAGARSSFATMSEMYANVSVNVEENMPERPCATT